MLEDLRDIEAKYGIEETYSFEVEYFEIEIYAALDEEITTMLTYALLIVSAMVLLITFNLRITIIVVFVVLLVVI